MLMMASLAVDSVDLDVFELAHGVRLPDEFRVFLLTDDLLAERGVFVVDGEHRVVAKLYRFNCPDLLADISTRRFALRGIVPDDLLAFARDQRGDLVCVGVRGPRHGGVFLVRLPHNVRRPITIRALAPSIDAFLEHLDVSWGDESTGVQPLPQTSAH